MMTTRRGLVRFTDTRRGPETLLRLAFEVTDTRLPESLQTFTDVRLLLGDLRGDLCVDFRLVVFLPPIGL